MERDVAVRIFFNFVVVMKTVYVVVDQSQKLQNLFNIQCLARDIFGPSGRIEQYDTFLERPCIVLSHSEKRM